MIDRTSMNFPRPIPGNWNSKYFGVPFLFPNNQDLVYISYNTYLLSAAAPWKSNKKSRWSNKRRSHVFNRYISKFITWNFQTLGLTLESIEKKGTKSWIWPRRIRFIELPLGCFWSQVYYLHINFSNSKTAIRW